MLLQTHLELSLLNKYLMSLSCVDETVLGKMYFLMTQGYLLELSFKFENKTFILMTLKLSVLSVFNTDIYF